MLLGAEKSFFSKNKMTVKKKVRCPFCQNYCLGDFYHDQKLNILCNFCNKIIFATNEEDEKELKSLYTKSPSRTTDYNHYETTTHKEFGDDY